MNKRRSSSESEDTPETIKKKKSYLEAMAPLSDPLYKKLFAEYITTKQYKKETLATHGLVQAQAIYESSNGSGKPYFKSTPVLAVPMGDHSYHCINYLTYPTEPRFMNAAKDEQSVPAALGFLGLKALDTDAPTIFITEGIWDMLTLYEMGYHVLGLPGVNNLREEWCSPLKGKHVIVLFDNDEAGRKYAAKHSRLFARIAETVKIITLPGTIEHNKKTHPIKDITDLSLIDPALADKTIETLVEKAETVAKEVRRPKLVCLDSVVAVPVEWLWEPYLPLGKLTILEGDPAIGKSFFAMTLAAIISRGWPFPDKSGIPCKEQRRPPAKVVYLSAEDNLADTMRARLDAAEADCSLIYALTGVESQRTVGSEIREVAITLADLDMLEVMLKEVQPSLLVIDPIQAYLGAKVDMHRANEVRPLLAGLARLAEIYRCATLIIRHLTKGQTDRNLYRGMGSIDFTAAARSVLLAGRDPENPASRGIVHLKCSNAPEGPSLGYELRDGKFFWTGMSDLTADAMLAPDNKEGNDEQATLLQEAENILRKILAKGPMLTHEVEEEAAKAGISQATLRRARASLKVESERRGGIGKEGQWWLSLPEGAQPSALKKEIF